MADGSPPADDLVLDRSLFNGTLVSTLAYGALVMLYAQLTQVLLSRPKRGKMYGAIVGYSTLLFCLATIAMAGSLKFAETIFVDNRLDPAGPKNYWDSHLMNKVHIMSQVCVTLLPWIGDIMMLYRLYIIWNSNRLIIVFPSLLYISRVAMSIPLLIAQTRPSDTWWAAQTQLYSTIFYSLCVSLNLFVSIAVALRLFWIRQKVEEIMGKLHASFYTGFVTIIVESGAFFTIWGLTYVVLMSRNSNASLTFLLPYTHVLAITRMLIALRMAQDRAWSKELASATAGGILDWQVTSTHSIPLHDVPASSTSMNSMARKYQESL
ncbi:hypothetical protein C0995_016132 [Termitomyces sp. Mi166|nr:hypothetical protein C0995_016132 [Termitomyces sp. Mi166\